MDTILRFLVERKQGMPLVPMEPSSDVVMPRCDAYGATRTGLA
ncbi:hypothetical protein [Agromyces ramosus]|nr:hypothetical protein [Agromyces ramosus]